MKRRYSERRVARRDFLKISSLILTAMGMGGPFAQASVKRPRRRVRFGIAADSHYADAPARGSRYYRESAAKLAECVELMNDRRADFLVHLGDFLDGMIHARASAAQSTEVSYSCGRLRIALGMMPLPAIAFPPSPRSG